MMNLFKYYGLDIIGMALILSSIYFIGSKKRLGFILGVIGNLSWLSFGIVTESVPVIFTNVILVLLNIRGYINWKKN
jgi:hypothetical protein